MTLTEQIDRARRRRWAVTRSMSLSRTATAFALTAPGAVLLGIFVLVPIVYGIRISLSEFDGLKPMEWIGLENYAKALRSDSFLPALRNTVVFAVIVVIGKTVMGLAIALVLYRPRRGSTLVRSAAFLPLTLSVIVVGAFWSSFLNSETGLLNESLRFLGLDVFTRRWLSDSSVALYSVAFVEIWRWMGFHAVLFIAALQTAPKDLYDASHVDGAGAWRQFWTVTIPHLRPVLFVSTLVALMGAFTRSFDLVWVLTRGAADTEVAVTRIYNEAFQFARLGRAAAMGFILFAILAVLTVVFTRLARGRDEDV